MSGHDAALRFLQRLIQTPSMPGEEGAIAEMVRAEMELLGYDETWVDEAGNAVGVIRGRGECPAMMFNTHLDHVDPGEEAAWPSYGQPYSGAVHDGKIWGRGASDIKGPLASQVYGVAGLLQGERPPGDVYVSAVVQEEVGGLGARFLAKALRDTVELVVIGEPSSNEVRRGHRGRTELVVHVTGRAVHASVPQRGVNPLYVLANFIQRLLTLNMAQHVDLGQSSVAPTLIRTDQKSANVTPGEAWLTLDWRNVPGEQAEDCRAKVLPLLEESLIPGASGEITVVSRNALSFTGYSGRISPGAPAYSIPADHPVTLATNAILSDALKRPIPSGFWSFATDGGRFAEVGMTIIGFAPGDEKVVHTVNEHISIAEFTESLYANEQLARNVAMALI